MDVRVDLLGVDRMKVDLCVHTLGILYSLNECNNYLA